MFNRLLNALMRMKRILLLIVIARTCILSVFSQTEIPEKHVEKDPSRQEFSDSLSLPLNYSKYNLVPEMNNYSTLFQQRYSISGTGANSLDYSMAFPLEIKESRFPFANDYKTGGIMPLSATTWITGGSSRETFLMGSITQTTGMYNNQLTDDLSIATGATIKKYELGGKQYNDVSLNALLSYRLNRQMNISLYGNYSVHRNDGNYGSFLEGFYPESPGEINHFFKPINTAALNFNYQVTDRLSLSTGTYYSQYTLPYHSYEDYGVNGRLGYQVNDHIKLNVMGGRSLKGEEFLSPTMKINPNAYYGGSMEFMFNNNFGVESGIIRELDMWTGKWTNKPFIMPIIHIK